MYMDRLIIDPEAQVWANAKDDAALHGVAIRMFSSSEVRQIRMEICKSCEYLAPAAICSSCNCFLPLKVWLSKEACPKLKWLSVVDNAPPSLLDPEYRNANCMSIADDELNERT